MQHALLAYLAPKFAAHPENVATDALAFLLGRSDHLRSVVAEIASEVGVKCAADLMYQSQVSDDDGARPDIVGSTPTAGPQLVIEGKFWAGLTENQPVGYLKSLPASNALVLFVAPSARIEVLWSELLRRVAKEPLPIGRTIVIGPDLRFTKVADRTLAVTNWRALLQRFVGSVSSAGDSAAEADIRQLIAMCEAQDEAAFLPLESEELTAQTGRRIIQFGKIVDDLVDRLVLDGVADVKGTRASAGNGWYSRPLRLNAYGCNLSFNAWGWSQWGDSPIWLSVKGTDWKHSAQNAAHALTAAGLTYYDGADGGDGWMVPISLPTRAERDAVVDAAIAQLRRVVAALSSSEPPPLFESMPSPQTSLG